MCLLLPCRTMVRSAQNDPKLHLLSPASHIHWSLEEPLSLELPGSKWWRSRETVQIVEYLSLVQHLSAIRLLGFPKYVFSSFSCTTWRSDVSENTILGHCSRLWKVCNGPTRFSTLTSQEGLNAGSSPESNRTRMFSVIPPFIWKANQVALGIL
jgi:hypothetical protein